MKTSIIAILFLLMAATSFSMGRRKEEKLMNSWLDHKKKELYLEWGPPSQTTSDGDNGEILIYSYHIYTNPVRFPDGTWVQGKDYYRNRMFYVDSKGYIHSWRCTSTPNPPQRVDVFIR